MNILFIVPSIDRASTRYRVVQYLEYLHGSGHTYSLKEISRQARRWGDFFTRIRRADLIFIQKKIFSPIEMLFIRTFAKKIIFDFDDSIMFKDLPAGDAAMRRQSRRFGRMARMADLIICGNEYLRFNTEPYNPNLRILPTPIDMNRYVMKPPSSHGNRAVTIGWIGSRVTLKYLQEISPALTAVAKKYPNTCLKIVADEFIDVEGMEVIRQPWSDANEIADLHSFDIGLMPLTDDRWTRGKCGFKLLQCMAVGLPVVCSPVGMNREIVMDGVDGFWANNQEEWIEKLTILIENHSLRKTMGAKGRQKVVEKYSLAVNCGLFLSFLNECLSF